MLAGCLALMAWVCLFRKVEVYYASFPWLNYTRGLKATPNGRTYQTRCPWTGALLLGRRKLGTALLPVR